MKKLNKATAAVAIGMVGVLALGACSSGSDQAEPSREAAQATASANPAQRVPIPKSAMTPLQRIWVANVAPSRCNVQEKNDTNQLVVKCSDVGVNLVGDNVNITVPNDSYRIQVHNVPTENEADITVIQRDWAYVEVNRSHDNNTTWVTPYKGDEEVKRTGIWSTGINSYGRGSAGRLEVVATVTYLGK